MAYFRAFLSDLRNTMPLVLRKIGWIVLRNFISGILLLLLSDFLFEHILGVKFAEQQA